MNLMSLLTMMKQLFCVQFNKLLSNQHKFTCITTTLTIDKWKTKISLKRKKNIAYNPFGFFTVGNSLNRSMVKGVNVKKNLVL